MASALVVAPLVSVAPSSAQTPRLTHRYTAKIEPLAGYAGQSTCSPFAKPGTTAFAGLLLRTYPRSRSLGIVRACSVGGKSEHKEGRAFDWGVSANDARAEARPRSAPLPDDSQDAPSARPAEPVMP